MVVRRLGLLCIRDSLEALGLLDGRTAGAALDFGKGRWLDLDRGIVTAASKEIHRELIEALKPGGAVGDA